MTGTRSLFGVATIATFLTLAAPVDGQIRMRNSDAATLREAATAESRGDLPEAERVLRGLLGRTPHHSGALFALERVLRAQGQVAEILPSVDAFLEVDSRSSGVRYLKLRVLADLDSLDALRDESEAWLEADPSSLVAYRDVARVYEGSFGSAEALALLRRGREADGRPDALALEIGDLLISQGDFEGAASEWAMAVGDDAGQVVTVTRRIQGLTEGNETVGRGVTSQLAMSPGLAQRRAAARIALDLGLGEEALVYTQEVASELAPRARSSFLADVARRARDQQLVDVASWAYDALGADASTPAERRQFDQRLVEVSLSSGDTAAAVDAQWRVAESFSYGSVDHRRATAQAIRLEAVRSDAQEMRGFLDLFHERFPNAPEADDLAATVSVKLSASGDPEGATAVLEGVEGPRSALERGFLMLQAGELQEGRTTLLMSATGLPPEEATPVIQFAGLIGRVSEPAATMLVEATIQGRLGTGEGAAHAIVARVDAVEEADRAPLLAEAARIADRAGARGVAADIRGRLLADYSDAAEAAEAALQLARFHASSPNGLDEAIRLLEELIVSNPNAAIVPDARVELTRLRSRGE